MIHLKNVVFKYPSSKAISLSIPDLTIKAGECIAVVGKSGSGKTTFLRILNGLIPNYYVGKLTGEITVGSFNPQQQAIEEMAKEVASVFQNPHTQFFHRRVEDELVFASENQGKTSDEIKKMLEEVLKLFDISYLLGKDLIYVSGGECQQVMIATAIMQNPKILILDEPTANLDMDTIQVIKTYLAKLKALGITIIIAEHRLNFLSDVVDRYLYCDHGQITNIYDKQAFLALSATTCQGLGLRRIQPTMLELKKGIYKKGLTIDNVMLGYPKKTLGTITHLAFNEGSINGLIGKNGCGKTTLAKTLTGLLNNDALIKYNNELLNSYKRLKTIAYVMQDIRLQLFMDSVEKEITYYNQSLTAFDEVVESLNLGHLLKRHPLSLSQGEMQRVVIAQALLSGKDIFIFDEPTSGLDYYHMMKVVKLMNWLKKIGKIVILISHDYEFLANCCDTIANLELLYEN